MDLLTEMRIPTRAAPKPPGRIDANHLSVPKNPNVWGSSNDLFGSSSVQVPQKKKPPPRPPPPKFPPKYSQVQNQEKPKKPARPTELLSNLFGRRTSNSHKQQQHHQQQQYSSRTTSSSSSSGGGFSSTSFANFGSTTATTTTFQAPCTSRSSEPSVSCLIDLSPPGSPTFTTRSSSDGVSVDSFGSDGNSNPSAFASSSSGSTSQTESAFEDDFDFFAGLAAAAGRKQNQPADPWRVSCSQDPFGSLEPPSAKPLAQQWPSSTQQYSQIKEVGESNFFAFNDASTTTSSSASGSPFDSPSKPPFKMPTIIWGRKPNQRKDSGGGGSSSNSNNSSPKISVYQSSASSNNYGGAPRFAPATKLPEQTQTKLEKSPWGDEDVITSTPPIPDQPPPEYIAGLEDGLVENSERPYGIALYDFPASQPGDLELKEGDVVYLTKLINDNWMEGRVDSREGIFPVNFVDVKIALPGVETNVVNALYAFKAETSDDLSFEEGARIKVLSRISDDWLYGEYNGQRGQFPANFVDKVPNDLPNHL